MRVSKVFLAAVTTVICSVCLNAQTKNEIPAYRQKGYAGDVSLVTHFVYTGLETSHGYMFNEHHFLGAGVGYSKWHLSWKASNVHLYADYKAYVMKRRSTLTAGLKTGYLLLCMRSEDGLENAGRMSLEPNVGWDWGLKNGYGLGLSAGVQIFPALLPDMVETKMPLLLPMVSFGFKF